MRIAVLADTHDRLPDHVLDEISAAREIWHLGDVCNEVVETRLEATGLPVRIVRGNCDENPNWPHALDFTIEGFHVHLVHVPPRFAPPGVDLLFHGHTHVPRYERVGHALFCNPGCITRPNRGAPASYAWLELTPGQPVKWELVYV